MSTRERILKASLDLFNEKGERNVTTNHIAAHLGISPGNLYYHFRNKADIVYEIFLRYRAMVEDYLKVPEGKPVSLENQFAYLELVFDGLWAYRFFHRDLEHFLEADPRLRNEYRDFTAHCLNVIERIIEGIALADVIRPLDDAQRATFALNTWLVVTNWMSFLKTARGDSDTAIDREALQQGIYQVVSLQIPFVNPPFLEETIRRQQAYQPQVSFPPVMQARG